MKDKASRQTVSLETSRRIQLGARYKDNDKAHSLGVRIVTRRCHRNEFREDVWMVGVANHRGITNKMSRTGMAYTWVHGTPRNALQPRGKL